jgi:hypothetical protein
MQSRADLHVHSRYSDRPSEWFLRRIGAPESFMEPMEVYRRAKARGMDFVTISDHNKIDGALEIGHLPDTFISCEVTTYFPDAGAKVHFLVSGITEAQFETIDRLREDIFELREYVIENEIIHSVAHPLFRANDRLNPDHIEQLLLLFNRFEGINGTRDCRAADLVSVIFRNLTPELIEKLANKHGIQPHGPTPWHKTFTGGSDDHGGVYIASAYTMTPYAESVEQYLGHLRAGNHEMGGSSGNSLMLAHSFYHIAYSYYKNRFMSGSKAKVDLLGEMLKNLLEKPKATVNGSSGHGSKGLRGRVRGLAERVVRNRRLKQLNDTERLLVEEFSKLFDDGVAEPTVPDSAQAFDASCRICHQLSWTFARNFVRHARAGDLVESLQTIASLGPVALSIAPYLASFATQHKDEHFMQEVARRFERAHHMILRSEKVAWVADHFADGTQTGRFVEQAMQATECEEVKRALLTCSHVSRPAAIETQNFSPVGQIMLPEAEDQPLNFPPFLEVIAHIEAARYGELVIATPGPMGLTAMAAAGLLNLRTAVLFDGRFSDWIAEATEDPALAQLSGRYLLWLADRADRVLVGREDDRAALLEAGVEPRKLRMIRLDEEPAPRRPMQTLDLIDATA